MQPVAIDGSLGEGGGQILRSSLSLSVVTGQAFKMTGIRANRPKPGLAAQHLLSVRAAAKLSGAKLAGDYLGSQTLLFAPGEPKSGDFAFDCGTAGSTALVFQTLLPIALSCGNATSLEIKGGTENQWAPTSFYLSGIFSELARRFGADFVVKADPIGWYPQGGGVLTAKIKPSKLNAVSLLERGKLSGVTGYSLVSNLPFDIAERQKTRCIKQLVELAIDKAKFNAVNLPSIGIGSEVFLRAEYAHGLAGFTALGEKGKAAEKVAGEAMHNFKEFHESGACIDEHAADQLLLFAALANGTTKIRIPRVTPHLETNARVVKSFLPDCRVELGEFMEVGGTALLG